MNKAPIYEGEWLKCIPITKQVPEFLDTVDDVDRVHLEVSMRIVETSMQTGRPPAGRAVRVAGSRVGLFELKVTPPGTKGPQLRLLYVQDGRELLAARILRKAQRKLPTRDIRLAERAVKEYREVRGERCHE